VDPVTSIHAALAAASRELEGSSDSPVLDAEILLAQVLGRPRAFLRSHGDDVLAAPDEQHYRALLARRRGGEPVAYLLGRREFWSLQLEVGPGVLVPRPETELLVDMALEALRGRRAPQVLDLGTGSGAIAIAIALEMPAAQVVAVDASPAALEIARRNAARTGAANVEFLAGDWYAPATGRRFDLIVSNPPYLAAGDPHLAALGYEPAGALVAGPIGLEALAEIVAGAADHLQPGGSLILEHGCDQGAAVRDLLAAAGLQETRTRRDLAGLERASLAQRPAESASSG
jgi:release factor glutamine methyltransferase